MKKLIEIEIKHHEWIKRTARTLGMFEREVMATLIENAITTNVMDAYKAKVAANQLTKTLARLSLQADGIAVLKEKAESQLRKLQLAAPRK